MVIMRVIVQTGHKGGLTTERPETTATKLARVRSVNQPRVTEQKEKIGVALTSSL